MEVNVEWGMPDTALCDGAPNLSRHTGSANHALLMLADWILTAAPGFGGEEDGDHEFQALPPRMTAVST